MAFTLADGVTLKNKVGASIACDLVSILQ